MSTIAALPLGGTIIAAWLWRGNALGLCAMAGAWAAFAAYSLPPLRLKGRGSWGILADASGAHLFPALMAVFAISVATSGTPPAALWTATVAVWAMAWGARGIIGHQIADETHDRASGSASIVVAWGREKARRAAAQDRTAEIDVTDLARPEVVFRHMAVALEGAEPAQDLNAPAGLFQAFAVQGADRPLAGIDAAAGQLELVARAGLLRHQRLAAVEDDAIGARPVAVGPPGVDAFAESSHGRGYSRTPGVCTRPMERLCAGISQTGIRHEPRRPHRLGRHHPAVSA